MAAAARLASSAARCAASASSALRSISSMCFSTQAVRTARAAGPSRHTTSCPAATQVPSPASRMLRPHLQ
eukprot:6289014-Alexandrium_andersonii.AAC.1